MTPTIEQRDLRGARMYERLARQWAREIVSGRMAAGERFPSSEELADRYDVSRTVGREASQALQAAGLIDVRHGRPTTVNPWPCWKVLEDLVKGALAQEQLDGELAQGLFEARAVLELATVRLCAIRAEQSLLDRLLARTQEMVDFAQSRRNTTTAVLARLIEDDTAFHTGIADGAGNRVMRRLALDIRQGLVPTGALEQLSRQELLDVATSHHEIAQALAQRDASNAAALMSAHLTSAVDTTLKRTLRPNDHAVIDTIRQSMEPLLH
jgi:GntR family transcriptional regulator, transcriptional repressor for pyruvate dehydrogenase complex